MNLRPGIPTLGDVDALKKDPLYAQHTAWNQAFLERHGKALEGYGKLWGQNPFKMWSRRWEYPFEAQKVLDFIATQGGQPLKMLDGGSGVTYVPYYLVEKHPELSVICCDTNTSYAPMFAAINKTVGHEKVTFQEAMLQKLPYEDGGLDIVCCISVLEHTDNYGEIISEFARVLRPGGLLVLTFDLSLDGKFALSKQTAEDLLRRVGERFDVLEGLDVLGELPRMDDAKNILSTDHVKATEPELLPWRYPMLKGIKDLVEGHGWTGGFRSKSVFCLNAIRK
jgi:ubiquinone/menaquinone biosynthesis C-methylase UbiE